MYYGENERRMSCLSVNNMNMQATAAQWVQTPLPSLSSYSWAMTIQPLIAPNGVRSTLYVWVGEWGALWKPL